MDGLSVVDVDWRVTEGTAEDGPVIDDLVEEFLANSKPDGSGDEGGWEVQRFSGWLGSGQTTYSISSATDDRPERLLVIVYDRPCRLLLRSRIVDLDVWPNESWGVFILPGRNEGDPAVVPVGSYYDGESDDLALDAGGVRIQRLSGDYGEVRFLGARVVKMAVIENT